MKKNSGRLLETVSITDFNRGKAGKIFDDVRKHGAKVVLKNNHPEAIILSKEVYENIMDELEDLRITVLAADRLKNLNPNSKIYTSEEVNEMLGVTQEEVDNAEDDELE